VDVALALVGVLLGWLLAQGGDLWLRRREARDAARVIAAELVDNLAKLSHVVDGAVGWRTLTSLPLEMAAWRTHLIALNRIVEVGVLFRLSSAYSTFATANAAVAAAREGEELRGELMRRGYPKDALEESRVRSEGDVHEALEAAREKAQSALGHVGPLADLSTIQLVFLRYGRRRQRRLYERDFPRGVELSTAPQPDTSTDDSGNRS
jgi:hypothetical protein